MCWWSTGVDGTKAPTIAATCGAQIPAAFTTSSVSMGPASVRTRVHLASCRQREPSHPDTRPDPDPERPRGVGDRVRGTVRVQVPIAGQVHRPVKRLGGHRRHQPPRLVGPDHTGIQADPARPAGGSLELAELVRARGQAKAAHAFEDTESLVQLDAVASKAHHRRRWIERRHQARGLTGGTGREGRLLHEQHVRPAGERQVISHATTGDPATDDDDARTLIGHGVSLAGASTFSRPPPPAAPARMTGWPRWQAVGRNARPRRPRSPRPAC